MRLYTGSDEESLRARKLLKEWTVDGILTDGQREQLGQEIVSDLRTTNIFLRLILFLFSVLVVGAAAGLFFEVFLSNPSDVTAGIFLLIFSGACYAAAEMAVYQARLYRHGIEEALALCSIGFLCAGLGCLARSGASTSGMPLAVPAAGVLASLWVWYRFNYWYAALAAMIFGHLLPASLTESRPAQSTLVVALYAVALAAVVWIRSSHRFDYLDSAYSRFEALLWLGIYLTINLKLSALELSREWWSELIPSASRLGFTQPFYWTTWVLIWCLPPIVLVRGVRLKDRLVIAVGAIVAVLTLISNKPYLGWPRHTWDPMFLGILLTGVAWLLRRWLVQGTDGVRHGFTAARLSGKDDRWLKAGSATLGLVTPHAITPAAQTSSQDFEFGGGASGGGGAGGDY